jgi:hypothetical protein
MDVEHKSKVIIAVQVLLRLPLETPYRRLFAAQELMVQRIKAAERRLPAQLPDNHPDFVNKLRKTIKRRLSLNNGRIRTVSMLPSAITAVKKRSQARIERRREGIMCLSNE